MRHSNWFIQVLAASIFHADIIKYRLFDGNFTAH